MLHVPIARGRFSGLRMIETTLPLLEPARETGLFGTQWQSSMQAYASISRARKRKRPPFGQVSLQDTCSAGLPGPLKAVSVLKVPVVVMNRRVCPTKGLASCLNILFQPVDLCAYGGHVLERRQVSQLLVQAGKNIFI